MQRIKSFQRQKLLVIGGLFILIGIGLSVRLGYLMLWGGEYYRERAQDLHERQRSVKAPRGLIYDRNGTVIAGNKAVCSISVIHSQIKEPEKVIMALSSTLGLDQEEVRKKVEKVSIREKIKSNVDKEIADSLRTMNLDGVMIDEDYKRYYPYQELASKVIGFTGADNQGIIGLEVQYDEELMGEPGTINTVTDAKGVELEKIAETRTEAIPGKNLYTTIDVNIQMYAQQIAQKAMEQKQAKGVSIIVMNPNNGELYAMVNVPEYNLNEPFTIIDGIEKHMKPADTTEGGESAAVSKQDLLNAMWRNFCINDTYEPGSTFKIVTATAALEEHKVTVNDTFSCPGFRIVEDRKIRCHKVTGHGQETFRQGIMNSCNPVFMDVAARVGVDGMYTYYERLGLFKRTGVDLPGEANSIMHKPENVGPVELATMAFGQSFQITPLQLLTAASAVVNGGTLVTPHFGMKIEDSSAGTIKELRFSRQEHVISKETSDTMKELLEDVIAEGSGKNAYLEGYRIGGKTATSEKLPRSSNRYISSFMGFVPADNPQIIALIMIDEPQGVYYGGTIAAPLIKELYEMVLPYVGIKPTYQATTEGEFPE